MNISDDHESTQSILLQTQCHFWTKMETTDETEIHFDLPGVGGTYCLVDRIPKDGTIFNIEM